MLLAARWRGVFSNAWEMAFREYLVPHGVSLDFAYLENLNKPLVDLLASCKRSEAGAVVLFEPDPLDDDTVAFLRSFPIPVVLTGHSDNAVVDAVNWNETRAYRQLTEKLLKVGCEKIIHWSLSDIRSVGERNTEAGIMTALLGNDVQYSRFQVDFRHLAEEWDTNDAFAPLREATADHPVGVLISAIFSSPMVAMFLLSQKNTIE